MPKENDFRVEDTVAAYTSTNTPTAVTWVSEGSTTLNIRDMILGTLYLTGITNDTDYNVTIQGVSVASGTLTAGTPVPVKISGYIGADLQLTIESTVDDSHGVVTAEFHGK